MTTDDLIDRLSANLRPVSGIAVRVRLSVGLAIGALVSLAYVVVMMGVRPDIVVAMGEPSFWMKWGYTISLAAVATMLTARLARPELDRLRSAWLMAIPVLVISAVGATELFRTPSGEWGALWLGASWTVCPWRVVALAIPVFAALLWSFRQLAPTRLRAAGAAMGLTSGACGATVYGVHCPETSAIFVMTWYSLGIFLAALLGTLVGPRLIRW